MLTIFAIPKAFTGHIEVIQRNAIRSWTLLRPECEIILLGDDKGTEEVAREFGVRHIPHIALTEFGTPRVDSVFQEAERVAQNGLLCHVNADIILMSDFMRAVSHVATRRDRFLMSGQRWNVEIDQLIDFGSNWEQMLRSRVARGGRLGFRTGVDYWVFNRGLFGEIPPFGVGRTYYDQWFFYRARERKADLIDATPVVMDVHQNHDYSHHPEGVRGVYHGPEHVHNRGLTGGRSHLFIIKDRTHLLTERGLKPTVDAWRAWRLLRTALVLYPSLPLPVRLVLKGINLAIDVAGRISIRLGVTRPYEGPQSMPTS